MRQHYQQPYIIPQKAILRLVEARVSSSMSWCAGVTEAALK